MRRWIAVVLVGLIGAAGVAGCSGKEEKKRPPRPFSLDTYEPPNHPAGELAPLVEYDRNQPLAVTPVSQTDDPAWGVRVEELTYRGATDEPVKATVVRPLRTGKFAGVVYAHGYTTFSASLREAKDLARLGVVTVLPFGAYDLSGDQAEDLKGLTARTVALRRALDLLAARPDVDPARLAAVGHNLGGIQVAPLAGVEPRLVGVCLMGTPPWLHTFGSRLTGPKGDPKAYYDELSRFDPVGWLAMPGKREVLLQFSTRDGFVPIADAAPMLAATTGTKKRTDYPVDDLGVDSQAIAERTAFLTRLLRLA